MTRWQLLLLVSYALVFAAGLLFGLAGGWYYGVSNTDHRWTEAVKAAEAARAARDA